MPPLRQPLNKAGENTPAPAQAPSRSSIGVPEQGPRTLLNIGRFQLTLDRPIVMGVVNATPDSFSDAGQFLGQQSAIDHAWRLVEQGADILDIGGESTRPGAPEVSAQQELDRIGPVIQALAACGVPLSIDTRKPSVMTHVLSMGVDMINDVAGFTSDQAVAAVANSRAAVCVMHMQGDPATMQQRPSYVDVVAEVVEFLDRQRKVLMTGGVSADRIVLDPGIGFGKTPEQNIVLIRQLDRLRSLGFPVLIGVSRKSLIGHLTGRAVDARLAGSLAGALAAVAAGAAIVRVHDVAQTVDALKVWQALGL